MSDTADYDHPARPSTAQPPPVHVPGAPSVHDLVIADLQERGHRPAVALIRQRKAFGLAKYSSVLQPGNGRDAVADAAEEAADLVVYLRQAQAEGLCVDEIYRLALQLVARLAARLGSGVLDV